MTPRADQVPSRRPDRRCHGEAGFVAGLEGVVFGLLVLVAGTIVVLNAWSVLQTRRVLDGAAREYLRAYTEGDDPADARSGARRALQAVLDGERRRPAGGPNVRLEEPDETRFGPCAEATISIWAEVPAARVPFIGTFGSTTVRVTHSELVDAHREIEPGRRYDAEVTPCGS